MEACDTLWGYRAVDQWLEESTGLHRTSWDYLFSLRNGFTAYSVLSPENGCFASVAPREAVASECIDASTATSGPHAFAVRFSRVSSVAASASTASPSLVATMANAL